MWQLPWTAALPWSRVVDINDVAGPDLAARLRAAQDQVVAAGGGVIFFPPGVYRFGESIVLRQGVILRGAPPSGTADSIVRSRRLTRTGPSLSFASSTAIVSPGADRATACASVA